VLSRHFQVIGVDSRMQGRSGGDPSSLSYGQMAADVEELLKFLKAPPALILGFSDGGIVGLLLAIRAPDRVRALAVSGANIQQDEAAIPTEGLEQMRSVVEDPASSAQEKALYRLMLDEPNLSFEQLTQGVRCPALIMAGDRDFIKIDHTVKIFQAIPGAELAIFPQSDHFFFADKPEPFNQMVVEFFLRH